MKDHLGWIEMELQAQRRFFIGFVSICAACLLRWRGCLKPEDSGPLAKLVFNLFFPALLFAKMSKAELSADLWNVAFASLSIHVCMIIIVTGLSRFVPLQSGFRGQWMISVLGANIGFMYPMILAAGDLAKDVFPPLVIWDIAGNTFVNFFLNSAVALMYSPLHESDGMHPPDGLVDAIGIVPTGSPSTYGRRSSASSQRTSQSETAAGSTGGCELGTELGPELPIAVEAVGQDGELVATAGGEAPMQSLSSLNRVYSSFVLALAEGTEMFPSRLRAEGKKRAAIIRKILVHAATSPPLLAVFGALLANLQGWRFSPGTEGILDGMGEPFGCLFFIVVGLNLRIPSAQKAWRQLRLILVGRMVLNGLVLALIWGTDIVQQGPSRLAVTMALCCPVSGMVMSYVMDMGYDRSLQAAVTGITNIISLVLLYVLLSISRTG